MFISNTHQQGEHHHDGKRSRTAVADQGEGNTDNGQNAADHAHVYKGVAEKGHGQCACQSTAVKGLRLCGNPQSACQNDKVNQQQKDIADQAELFAEYCENKVSR